MRNPVLPDVLRSGMDVVFCGTAAGHTSARVGAYYAHPHNKFWRVLYETGLTPRLFRPEEYAELSHMGIGLTDIAKFDHGPDAGLRPDSLSRASAEALRRRILSFTPRVLAFTSMTAGATFFGKRRPCGLQPEKIGNTQIWILPSTSGLACGTWDIGPWHALAKMLGTGLENSQIKAVIDERMLSR